MTTWNSPVTRGASRIRTAWIDEREDVDALDDEHVVRPTEDPEPEAGPAARARLGEDLHQVVRAHPQERARLATDRGVDDLALLAVRRTAGRRRCRDRSARRSRSRCRRSGRRLARRTRRSGGRARRSRTGRARPSPRSPRSARDSPAPGARPRPRSSRDGARPIAARSRARRPPRRAGRRTTASPRCRPGRRCRPSSSAAARCDRHRTGWSPRRASRTSGGR